MYKLDFQKASIVGAILLSLIALYVALSVTQAPAPVAPVASTQSFACAPGTMCVQNAGKQVDILSGGTFNINAGAVFTQAGLTQYAYSYWDMDGTNGAKAAHGLGFTPTYPSCMLYTPVWVTASVYISAANATSVTLAMFDAAGNPYSGDPLAVRCSAVYVP